MMNSESNVYIPSSDRYTRLMGPQLLAKTFLAQLDRIEIESFRQG